MSADNIKVALRVRPLIEREIKSNCEVLWETGKNCIYQKAEGRNNAYSFDDVFDLNSDNAIIFNKVVKPIVECTVQGFNGTIFAYGQTSSGKTHTMMGCHFELGVIPLCVDYIFQRIKKMPSRKFLVRASYIEIYNEKINDLLNIEQRDIKIHEDYAGNVFVKVKEEVCDCSNQLLQIIKRGNKNRRIGATNMNLQSSRSHTIFKIIIESSGTELNENGSFQVACLNMVDLAGSEKLAQTNASGVRFKEGANINQSLSTLGFVIRQLSEGSSFVNFRDSKLTRILQQSLGGNSKTLIIANITPASLEDTCSTLAFASRAKSITNKPELNEVMTDAALMKRYACQISKLKDEMSKLTLRYEDLQSNSEQMSTHNEKLKNRIFLMEKSVLNTRSFRVVQKADRRHTLGGQLPFMATLREEPILSSDMMDFSFDKSIVIVDEINECDVLPELEAFEMDLLKSEQDKNRPVSPEEEDDELYLFNSISDDNDDALCNSPHKELKTPDNLTTNVITDMRTPPTVLRKRIQYYQDEFESLQEMTRLEKELKELDTAESLKEEIVYYKKQFLEMRDAFDNSKQTVALYENELERYKLIENDLCRATIKINELKCNINQMTVDHQITTDILNKRHGEREQDLLTMISEFQSANMKECITEDKLDVAILENVPTIEYQIPPETVEQLNNLTRENVELAANLLKVQKEMAFVKKEQDLTDERASTDREVNEDLKTQIKALKNEIVSLNNVNVKLEEQVAYYKEFETSYYVANENYLKLTENNCKQKDLLQDCIEIVANELSTSKIECKSLLEQSTDDDNGLHTGCNDNDVSIKSTDDVSPTDKANKQQNIDYLLPNWLDNLKQGLHDVEKILSPTSSPLRSISEANHEISHLKMLVDKLKMENVQKQEEIDQLVEDLMNKMNNSVVVVNAETQTVYGDRCTDAEKFGINMKNRSEDAMDRDSLSSSSSVSTVDDGLIENILSSVAALHKVEINDRLTEVNTTFNDFILNTINFDQMKSIILNYVVNILQDFLTSKEEKAVFVENLYDLQERYEKCKNLHAEELTDMENNIANLKTNIVSLEVFKTKWITVDEELTKARAEFHDYSKKDAMKIELLQARIDSLEIELFESKKLQLDIVNLQETIQDNVLSHTNTVNVLQDKIDTKNVEIQQILLKSDEYRLQVQFEITEKQALLLELESANSKLIIDNKTLYDENVENKTEIIKLNGANKDLLEAKLGLEAVINKIRAENQLLNSAIIDQQNMMVAKRNDILIENVTTELNDTKLKLCAAENHIEILDKDHESHASAVYNFELAIKNLNNNMQNCETALFDAKNKIAEDQILIEKVQNEIRELEKTNCELTTETSTLRTKIKEQNDMINNLNACVSKWKSKYEFNLENVKNIDLNMNDKLAKQKNYYTSKIDDINKEKEEMLSIVNQQHSVVLNKNDEEIKEAQRNISNLIKIIILCSEILGNDLRLDEEKPLASEINNILIKLDSEKQRINDKMQRLNVVEKQRDDLQSEIITLRKELEEQKLKYKELDDEIIETVKVLEDSRRYFNEHLAAYSKETTKEKQELLAVQNEQKTYYTSKIEAINKEKEEMSLIINQQRSSVLSKDEEIKESQRNVSNLIKIITVLCSDILRNDFSLDETKHLETEINNVLNKLDSEKQRINNVMQHLNNVEKERDDLQSEIVTLRKELDGQKLRYKELDDEIVETVKVLEDSRRYFNEHMAAYRRDTNKEKQELLDVQNELKKDSLTKQARIVDLEGKLQSLNKSYDDKLKGLSPGDSNKIVDAVTNERKISELMSKLKAANQELQAYKDTNNQYEQKMQEWKMKRRQVMDTSRELNDDDNAAMEALKTEMKQLKKELALKNVKVFGLEQELKLKTIFSPMDSAELNTLNNEIEYYKSNNMVKQQEIDDMKKKLLLVTCKKCTVQKVDKCVQFDKIDLESYDRSDSTILELRECRRINREQLKEIKLLKHNVQTYKTIAIERGKKLKDLNECRQ